ncbi:YkgJ family cysteine cluster protein, partial [bacterium]|nr:YkgJ family cysteine cluster protein [bacterium]
MTDLLLRYQALLAEADAWFARCQELRPQEIRCARGCHG